MRYISLSIIFIFLFTAFTHAANLSIISTDRAVIGEIIAVDISATTDGRSINSIDAAVRYQPDAFEFVGYQDGIGVVRFWIEQPRATDGIVSFVGGIPGGVDRAYGSADGIPLVRLLFKATAAGNQEFEIIESNLLQNDGKGTPLVHTHSSRTIAIDAGSQTNEVADTNPPQPFTITLVPRERSSSSPQLITFSAHDRESGIKGYFVKTGLFGWKAATSPYEVKSRFFARGVAVKAEDIYGNEQISRIVIPGIVPWWVGAIALVVIAAGIWRYFVIKKNI